MSETTIASADPREIGKSLRQLCSGIGCRLGGSPAEAKARRWLADRFRQIGLSRVRIEEFTFNNSSFQSCEGRWVAGRKRGRLDVRPMAYCPSTPAKGLEGELVFLGSGQRLHEPDETLTGKVGLFLGFPAPDPEFLRSLCNCGISAAIVLDHRTYSSWPVTLNFPEAWSELVTLPMFSLPYDQGWDLARKRGARVRLKAKCRRFRSTSGNVAAELPGRMRETIVLTAHLDSVYDSVGADDDASGIALITEVARLLAGKKRRRTIRFVGVGMEERLSVGAFHHAQRTLQKNTALALNFDSVAALLGCNQWHVCGHTGLKRYMKQRVQRLRFPAEVLSTVTPYSDHFPFNMLGIPSAWLYRPSHAAGTWYFHSARNVLANVSTEVIAQAASFTARIVHELAEMKTWPFPKTIPAATMKEIRQYAEWKYGVGKRL